MSKSRRRTDHLLSAWGDLHATYVKGLVTMVNSFYSAYRMEDVWLDK